MTTQKVPEGGVVGGSVTVMLDATVIKLKYVEAEAAVSVKDEPDVMPEILRVEMIFEVQ